MWREAGALGAGIVGGDLVSAPQWVVSVTALGDLEGRAPVVLSGARQGDVVAVAGELGPSAAGYALLVNGVRGFDELRQRHLVPVPPYGQGRAAADAGATSMTDVSDGLVADVGHIARASGVGIDLSLGCTWIRPRRPRFGSHRAGRRSVGLGSCGRRGPRARRDVPWRAAHGMAADRHGDRRTTARAARRRTMARRHRLAVVPVTARTEAAFRSASLIRSAFR